MGVVGSLCHASNWFNSYLLELNQSRISWTGSLYWAKHRPFYHTCFFKCNIISEKIFILVFYLWASSYAPLCLDAASLASLAYCADKNVMPTFRNVPAVWRLCLKSSSDATAHFSLFIKPLTHRTRYCVGSSAANWKHHLTRRLKETSRSYWCLLDVLCLHNTSWAVHRIVSAVHNIKEIISFCGFLCFF